MKVLEKAGYHVELAGLECCGRPMISKGFLYRTRALIQRQAGSLRRRLSGGVPLLGLEPSCLLTLADEWTELLPGADTRAVADACHLADGWRLNRVDSILRAILRAGAYEMLMRKDVPPRVVITEYVDLAHAFFEGEEPKVVNGILDKLGHEERPQEFARQGPGRA